MGFFIQREPQTGQINPKLRWLTVDGGWSSNFRKAQYFPTRRKADNRNATRDVIIEARACRRCNCTDMDACISKHGESCSWVEGDLCSACLTPVEAKRWANGDPKPSGGKD